MWRNAKIMVMIHTLFVGKEVVRIKQTIFELNKH